MRNSLRDFKRRALARPGVCRGYEELKAEFELKEVQELQKKPVEVHFTEIDVPCKNRIPRLATLSTNLGGKGRTIGVAFRLQ